MALSSCQFLDLWHFKIWKPYSGDRYMAETPGYIFPRLTSAMAVAWSTHYRWLNQWHAIFLPNKNCTKNGARRARREINMTSNRSLSLGVTEVILNSPWLMDLWHHISTECFLFLFLPFLYCILTFQLQCVFF